MSLKSILFPAPIDGATSIGFSTVLAWIVGIIGAALLAPFVMAAVGGLLGLVFGLAVLWASLKFAPVFGIVVGNQTLKLLKWDAAKNPVETLESIWVKNEAEIKATEATVLTFSTEVEAYTPTVVQMEREYPDDAPQFRKHLDGMAETRDLIYAAITAAKEDQVEFKKHIKRVGAIWAATQTGNKLSLMAGRLSKTEAIDQIRTDAALNAVQTRVAGTFANLDHLRRSMKDSAAAKAAMKPAAAALPNNPSPTALQAVSQGSNVYEPVKKG